MDTRILESFAQNARRALLEQVAAKLEHVLRTDSVVLREYARAVELLKAEIRKRSQAAVVDEVAYTWFNRFCALRYMDVNGYNHSGVVSPLPGHTQPEVLLEAKQGMLDESLPAERRRRVSDLLNGNLPSADPEGEAYRLLLVAHCNALHQQMPFLFEAINDYTELLLPDDLLSSHAILHDLRAALTPENCADVEVIGWLYQFYISEKKAEVLARKGPVPSADVPARTQLFTPHWIVRYMVENSLGRLWLLNHPESRLAERMDYYIAPEQELTDFLRVRLPEELRLCDPACGSGHILTYAFDLLYAIYEEQGYEPAQIPRLILEKNLTGIEIDPRAGDLAAFALAMKARAKDRRFFSRGVRPDICVLEDVAFAPKELEAYLDAVGRDLFTQDVAEWLRQFEQASTFGALIRPRVQDVAFIRRRLAEAGVFENLFLSHTHEKMQQVLAMTEALSPRYHVVVANPPYMGGRSINDELKAFLKNDYDNFKSDLFAAFTVRIMQMIYDGGVIGIMTPFTWMFLSSYEALRTEILDQSTLTSLVRPEYHAFFDSAYVPICAFSLFKRKRSDFHGAFIDLSDFYGADLQPVKTLEAIQNPGCGWFYRAAAADFKKIPGSPIAYWISSGVLSTFDNAILLKDILNAKTGITTGDNPEYIRFWVEVEFQRIGFGTQSRDETFHTSQCWYPLNSGGQFRKWFGNFIDIILWQNDGELIRARHNSNIRNQEFFFREGLTWGKITSSNLSARYSPEGCMFDAVGLMAFPKPKHQLHVLGLLNSNLVRIYTQALNPTLSMLIGDLDRIPFIEFDEPTLQRLNIVVSNLVDLAKDDWNNYETAWGFPGFLCSDSRDVMIANFYLTTRLCWQSMTQEMQRLEEENNRIFIEAYGLQEELSPEAPLNEITLTCNPHYRYGSARFDAERWDALARRFPALCEEIAAIAAELAPEMPEATRLGLEQRLLEDTLRELISYAVGCMFGRYSLDKPGLILANQGETLADYLRQIPAPAFTPDADNVIPLVEGDYFANDLPGRFKAFLKVAFGEDSYAENLAFIETALGRDIASYFLRDFYKDHVQTYKKRPIYWLFSSPKGSFNALVYMHRYRPDTVSVVLRVLREFRAKVQARRAQFQAVERSASATAGEKAQATKALAELERTLAELKAYEDDTLYPLASQQLAIDLDDGVVVNYAKFGKAVWSL